MVPTKTILLICSGMALAQGQIYLARTNPSKYLEGLCGGRPVYVGDLFQALGAPLPLDAPGPSRTSAPGAPKATDGRYSYMYRVQADPYEIGFYMPNAADTEVHKVNYSVQSFQGKRLGGISDRKYNKSIAEADELCRVMGMGRCDSQLPAWTKLPWENQDDLRRIGHYYRNSKRRPFTVF